MVQLFRFWLGLCLLRAAPQDMPASHWVLGFSVLSYALVSILVLALSYGFADGASMALMELGLLAAFITLLLYLTGKPERIRQTLAAMAGAGALLGIPALLLVLVVPPQVGANQPLSLAWLVLLIWNLLVTAHIMRHALSVSMLLGLGAALLYSLVSTQFIVTAFPQLAVQ